MNARLRIQEEELLSKGICWSIVSLSEPLLRFLFALFCWQKFKLFNVCMWYAWSLTVWLFRHLCCYPLLVCLDHFCFCSAIMHYPRASIHYHNCWYIYSRNSKTTLLLFQAIFKLLPVFFKFKARNYRERVLFCIYPRKSETFLTWLFAVLFRQRKKWDVPTRI